MQPLRRLHQSLRAKFEAAEGIIAHPPRAAFAGHALPLVSAVLFRHVGVRRQGQSPQNICGLPQAMSIHIVGTFHKYSCSFHISAAAATPTAPLVPMPHASTASLASSSHAT
mmetsp:Transcript_92793/g.127909  ORF Transcript_92793/g.127909 Transcript_92793/m.127909 type:complete len:112 (+) Transcript_92793:229-564(+)